MLVQSVPSGFTFFCFFFFFFSLVVDVTRGLFGSVPLPMVGKNAECFFKLFSTVSKGLFPSSLGFNVLLSLPLIPILGVTYLALPGELSVLFSCRSIGETGLNFLGI